jgi:hypothetical protein
MTLAFISNSQLTGLDHRVAEQTLIVVSLSVAQVEVVEVPINDMRLEAHEFNEVSAVAARPALETTILRRSPKLPGRLCVHDLPLVC